MAYRLSGAKKAFTLPDYEEACNWANVPYTVFARPKMVHCYCMLPIFKESKEGFAKIAEILEK